MRLLFAVLSALALLSGSATSIAADTCRAWTPEDAARNDLQIGEIMVNPRNIFNTENDEENAWYHRLGNQLHIKTQPRTITRQLLFREGDALLYRLLEESERELRANSYIKDASITPLQVCGDRVTLQVNTIDHWTLTPSVSLGRSGGESSATYNIEENNLFGSGKAIGYAYKDSYDRTSQIFDYNDQNLFGSRRTLRLSAEDNSDGGGFAMQLALPFYQLDSRDAWGLSVSDLKSQVTRYENTEEVVSFSRQVNEFGIERGWSAGYVDGEVKRWRLGWFFSSNEFDANTQPERFETPAERTLSYPWLGFEWFRENYIKIPNLTIMDAVQDVYIGERFSATLGLAAESFGSDDDYVVSSARYSRSYQPNSHQLTQFSLVAKGVLGAGPQHNTTLSATIDWYHFLSSYYTFLVSGTLLAESNQPLDRQYLLGGEDDLRGFPLRYAAGDRLATLSLEQRHMYSVYPWRLFQIASAAFIDVGSAWYDGDSPRWLGDAGIGLRIFPTRTSGRTVIHADLAFPVDPDDDIDPVQFTVTTKVSF